MGDEKPTSGEQVRAAIEAIEAQVGVGLRSRHGDSAATGHNAITSLVVFYSDALRDALARAEGAERKVVALEKQIVEIRLELRAAPLAPR